MKLKVEVSAGELFDKMTILEIKLENIRDATKLANIGREYAALLDVIKREVTQSDELVRLRVALKDVNSELWRIEDAIRAEEKAGTFGPEFVALARSVYRTNDRRMSIKREINELLRSDLIEEKSYATY
jgi:hypothetical protein